MEFTLLWAALTGVVFAWIGTKIWSEGLPDHPADRMIGAAAGGLLIGRLTEMFLQGINPITNPLDILIVRGGVHTGMASLGAVTAYLWSAKWNLRYLDATAPAALFGLAGWHAGCVWRGACLGTESAHPWAWAQDGSAITRHPVELYAALGFVIAAFVVAKLSSALLVRTGTALALAGLIRLATEPMRPSITGGPVGWYMGAIVVGLVIAAVGARLIEQRIPQPT
ncbi:MAG: prolipoprotein diacylglyceryl transferase family protein [Actinomycetota bacterium]|nr:prolipoprotein diacylglyceryl transferase family protein [Actinomycetota bacterium]